MSFIVNSIVMSLSFAEMTTAIVISPPFPMGGMNNGHLTMAQSNTMGGQTWAAI